MNDDDLAAFMLAAMKVLQRDRDLSMGRAVLMVIKLLGSEFPGASEVVRALAISQGLISQDEGVAVIVEEAA